MRAICQRFGMTGVVAAALFGAVIAGQATSPAQMSAPVALASFASVQPVLNDGPPHAGAVCSPQNPCIGRMPTCQQDPYQKGCGVMLRARRRG